MSTRHPSEGKQSIADPLAPINWKEEIKRAREEIKKTTRERLRRWNKERPGKALIRKWQLQLITPSSECTVCGDTATDVGHVIPVHCFLESGLTADSSYFRKNLLPMCRDCNQDWVDWDTPNIIERKWGKESAGRWYRLLFRRVRQAHNKRVWVYLNPSLSFWKNKKRKRWPGVVVLAPPKDRRALYLEVVGYDATWEKSRYRISFGCSWRERRMPLYTLVEQAADIIREKYELTERAWALLKEWSDK